MDKLDSREGSQDSTKNDDEPSTSATARRSSPTYIYTREKLFDIAYSPAAQVVPEDIARYKNDGHWSFLPGNSRGNSPQTTVEGRDHKKKGDGSDREMLRRRPSDPRERIKEEKDSVVLSPQRRSFNTGCHVQPSNTQHSSGLLRPPSNVELRDHIDRDIPRDRLRDPRRVGSGRIQMDKDRDLRPLRDDRRLDRKDERRDPREVVRRDDRDVRDMRRDMRREPRREETRDMRRDPRRDETRDMRRDDRRDENKENRFDRGDRGERGDRGDRPRHDFDRERSLPPREFPESANYGRRKNGRRYRNDEEPEWFSGGPTSQMDTIELRGFDRGDETKEDEPVTSEDRPRSVQDTCITTENTAPPETLSVTDKNGSMETNESSSPDAGQQSDDDQQQPSPPILPSTFDLNKFFNLDIPGLPEGTTPPPDTVVAMESRFTRWFNTAGSQGNSREMSRQSSLTEDQFLNELVNTISRSPVCDLDSPQDGPTRSTLATGTINDTYPSVLDEAFISNNSATSDKLNTTNVGNNSPNGPTNQLKALLFGKKLNCDSTPNLPLTPQHLSGLSGIAGKIKTVEELEADMRRLSVQQSPVNNMAAASTPQHKDLTGDLASFQQKDMTGDLASFQQKDMTGDLTSFQQKDMTGDLTAFNKLLSMMQANAAAASAAADSPKLSPIRPENRGASPMVQPLPTQIAAAIAQNEFRQAISRNKEQQIQIQQHVLKNMKAPPPPPLRLPQPPQSSLSRPPQPPITQETILNIIKQQQQNLLQQPLTTRSPSPHPMLQTQFLQQPPPSPRNPSPIMFSQQPPLNLNAPSPVNPGQLGGPAGLQLKATSPVNPTQLRLNAAPSPVNPVPSTIVQNLNPNTLSVSSNNQISRVPSPQELIVHTQAIMQNALIKKQLEEQKERYNRKQQERAKSPNAFVMAQPRPNVTNFVSSPIPVKPNVPASFTPTSVIRKMHSDKAEEKEKMPKTDASTTDHSASKPPDSNITSEPSENGRIPNIHNDILIQIEAASAPGSKSSTPSSLTHAPPVVLPCPQPTQTRPNINQQRDAPTDQPTHSEGGAQVRHGVVEASSHSSCDQPQQDATLLLSQAMRSGRPLIGSSTMQNTIPIQVQTINSSSGGFNGRPIVKGQGGVLLQSSPSHQPQPNSVLLHIPNMDTRPPIIRGQTQPVDVVKLLEQHRLRQLSPQPLNQRPSLGPPSSPLLTRMPLQPNAVNPLLMRPPNPAIRNSAMLNHLSLAALQQQHSLATLATVRGMYPGAGGMPSMLNPRNAPNSMQALNNQALINRGISPQMPLQNNLMNCSPMSTNTSFQPHVPNNLDFLNTNRDPNLTKWFGVDVLNTKLPPAFPPGKKVLTVDELEQNHQTVTY